MQKKLQKYIDLLIEMAGSENNYDVIKEELNEVEKEIESKKNELKNIKKSMKDDKYLKENDRIIDENIKIGLENKKQVYQYELDKILKLINKASVDEEDNHQALTSVISRLKSLNALLNVLQDKLKVVVKDKNLSSFYENMIEDVTNEVNELEKKKDILTKKYDKVRESLEYYGNKRSELDKKMEHLNIRLEDTLEALSTPNFYVDEFMKKKDENVVDELTHELETLENNRLSLITDPTYIGKEAMKLYNDEDYTSALRSIKELVTIVKSKPYMNESKRELNSLLKQAEITLDEFANNMDNNTYLGDDSKIVENRISYLEHELETVNNEITNIKNRIVDIDKNVVIKISEELSKTEDLYYKLKEEYEEYKNVVLLEDDTLSPRKKANLLSAYNRKKEEMDLVYKVFGNYQKELEETIMNSEKLETTDLALLEKKKDDISEEIEDLKKVKASKTRVKDVLAMEKDKATLNQLSLDVDNIKHSQKYDKKADDIYKEIETLFKNGPKSEVVEEEALEPDLNQKDFVNLDEFKIEEEKEEDTPVYETKPIEPEEEPIVLDNEPEVEEPKEEPIVLEQPIISEPEPISKPFVLEPTPDENEAPAFNEIPVIDKAPVLKDAPVIDSTPIFEEVTDSVASPVFEKVPEPVKTPMFKEVPDINAPSFEEPSVLEEPSSLEEPFKPDEKILQTADANLEDTKVFPPRNTVIPTEERYKVVNIEELPTKEDVPVKEEPEVLGEVVESLEEPVPVLETVPETLTENNSNNGDYISFNDILNGDGYNGN